jgi:hypothetical protein
VKWPWRSRQHDAENRADVAEAELMLARVEYLKARDLAAQARHEAEKSKKAHAENGFAQLIRTAMGVPRDHRP